MPPPCATHCAKPHDTDPAVFLLGEDIGAYGGAFKVTAGLLDRYGPERIRDTPIAENTIVGLATGAALMGMRPVCEIMFMDFIALAMDQIVNHAAKFHYMYGRAAAGADRHPHPQRRRPRLRPDTSRSRWKPGSCTRPA